MVGAEMPMTSDQVIWSEQSRLHVAYDGCTNDDANGIGIPVAAGIGLFAVVLLCSFFEVDPSPNTLSINPSKFLLFG